MSKLKKHRTSFLITQFPNHSIFEMRVHSKSRAKPHRNGESGYILLFLLLGIAVLIIAAAVAAPTISFDIKRDREEEMIHRGVQYSRAIRGYYKKFGRYPVKLEDLESTNNLRFLRKRYKDPITGQDFKLLHFGDVKLTFAGGMIGGMVPGAGTMNGAPGMNAAAGAFNAGNAALAANQIAAVMQSTAQAPNLNGQTDSSQPNSNPNAQGTDSGSSNSPSGGDQLSKTTFGGGPIVGVVSSSKRETIREFNNKKKYNEWQFIYDPGTDRGGLLMTPNQPPLIGMGQSAGAMGPQNLTGGTTMPTGLQNNPVSPTMGDFGNQAPQPPPNPPQQQ